MADSKNKNIKKWRNFRFPRWY